MPRNTKSPTLTRTTAAKNLRSYAKEHGVTQAAKWAGVPTSTLNGWINRRSIPERSFTRSKTALKSLSKEEKGFKRDVRQLSKEFRNLDKLNNAPQFAKASRHQTRTVERWQKNLKDKPTPALVKRIKDGFTRADNEAFMVGTKDKVHRNKNGDVTKTVGREETWSSVRPPKGADRYRLIGVDKDGNVKWSTISGDNPDDVISDADDISDQYDTTEIQWVLTYIY